MARPLRKTIEPGQIIVVRGTDGRITYTGKRHTDFDFKQFEIVGRVVKIEGLRGIFVIKNVHLNVALRHAGRDEESLSHRP